MEKIYLDNGATSFPKPREVADAVYEYMTSIGANINRGGYQVAYDQSSRRTSRSHSTWSSRDF